MLKSAVRKTAIPSFFIALKCIFFFLIGDFCDVNQCQNGGTCLKSLDQSPFFCLCAEGFTGPTCNETEKGEYDILSQMFSLS